MKILRPFTGTGAVFFPVGLPPKGTCEFATLKCMRSCYAVEENNWDEETKVTQEEKWEIYKMFMECPLDWIVEEIMRELDGLQTNILHWFGTGDCQTKDVDRILMIIGGLRAEWQDAPIQMGFTRNERLWEEYKEIFALTIEDKGLMADREGMFAVPDYDKQISVMTSPGYEVRGGYCGPTTCKDKDGRKTRLEHYINCKICCRLKQGCFDKR